MADKNLFKVFYTLNLGLQLGFLIIVPLVLFFWAGAYLDQKMNSSPWFLILFIGIAFVFIVFELRQYFLPLFKKAKKD